MAIFKCKMCGGDLEIVEGASIAECEYCGTKQTVPKDMDDNLQNLFNRANTLRIKGEFDKAEKLYEKIIQADTKQSEAYWGLILCKYGIEYVDDPTTFKKIPTCHRASYDSIIADDDYKAAIENADISQRTIYEEQAKEIDRIQKEETYDVFICYKETDADGKRTPDSVIANDIYYQLTQEGFKVFYAAITLEGKLGSAYEPIIFAALNSAKVMLSIGTKPEYFNAVWVKNEWSRFLKIIQKDRSKLLIPCYRDMDAYELPEEFAHLQAQDMSKIGFINDLIRGIKKVITKDEEKLATVTKSIETNANANVAPLIERAFLFLEDGNWESADEYSEKALDIDPKNAEAYLGKLMVELKCKKRSELEFSSIPFLDFSNYQKAVRFADADLKSELEKYAETAQLEHTYIDAKSFLEKANRLEDFHKIADELRTISHYKDASQLIDVCHERIEALKLKQAEKHRIAKQRISFIKKASIIVVISVALIAGLIYLANAIIIPEMKYNKAIKLIEEQKYEESYLLFKEMYEYKDAHKYLSRFTVAYDEMTSTDVSDGSDLYSTEYSYDENGNLLKETYTDWSGTVYIYIYDTNGNLLEETSTYSDGSVYTDEHTYDTNGNRLKTVNTDSTGVVTTGEFTYDISGNLLKAVRTKSTGDVITCEFTYDISGNLLKAVNTDSTGDVRTCEFIYDTDGNLLKKYITYSDGENETVYPHKDDFKEKDLKQVIDLNNIDICNIFMFGEVIYYISNNWSLVEYDEFGRTITYIGDKGLFGFELGIGAFPGLDVFLYNNRGDLVEIRYRYCSLDDPMLELGEDYYTKIYEYDKYGLTINEYDLTEDGEKNLCTTTTYKNIRVFYR